MKIKPLKSFKLLAIAGIAGICSFQAKAQIGVKLMQFIPGKELSMTYKKGLSFEAYYTIDYKEHRIRSRVGFLHANAQPQLDTFHITGTIGSGQTLEVVPGFERFEKLTINGIFIDHTVRVFKVKQFAFFAGIGMMGSYASFKYDRAVEKIFSETDASIQDLAVGLRGNLVLCYEPNKHLFFTAEIGHNAIVANDWSRSYAHHTIGFSVNYYIKEIKSHTPVLMYWR